MIKVILNIINYVYNNLLSVMSIIIALIALFQTKKQIELNNRQFLFDKRLRSFSLVTSLLELYKETECIMDYDKYEPEDPISVSIQFINLTNVDYLKDIAEIIVEPKNNDYKIKFLSKMEELKKTSVETRFIFREQESKFLSSFIYDYQNVLIEMYKYEIILDTMIKDEIPRESKATYTELQKNYGEPIHRKRLYNSIEKLSNSYRELINKNALKNIEKDLKL